MSATSEIYLRYWRVEDAPELLALYRATPDLERQLPAMQSLEDAGACVQKYLLPEEGRLALALDDGGRVLGCIRIDFIGDGASGGYDRGWVSYWAAPALRGQGITRTAVKAVCDWVLGHPFEPLHSGPQGWVLDASLLVGEPSPQLRRLELGYRTNNPASGAIARSAGFTVEGLERGKFLIDGQAIDAVVAGRLAGDPVLPQAGARVALHHLELWTADYAAAYPGWDWLLRELGFREGDRWERGTSWAAQDGSYIVLEESPDTVGRLNRCNPGMNHLALNCSSFTALEKIRARAASQSWQELYPEKYPHAGGEGHTALYLVNREGFEVELVVAKKL